MISSFEVNGMDLLEFVKQAGDRDANQKASRLDLEASKESYEQSLRRYWPSVYFNTGYKRKGPKYEDEYGKSGIYSLYSSMPVWSWGDQIGEDIADIGWENTKLRHEGSSRRALSQYISMYYSLIKTWLKLKNDKERLSLDERIFQKTKRRYDVGEIDISTVDRLKLGLTISKFQLRRLKESWAHAQLDAWSLLGMKEAKFDLRTPKLKRLPNQCTPGNFEKLAREKPSSKVQKNSIDMMSKRITKDTASYAPSFDLSAYWERDFTKKERDPYYEVKLGMSMTLFSKNTLNHNRRATSLQQTAAILSFDKMIEEEVNNMKKAYNNYNLSIKERDILRLEKKQSDDLYDIVEKKYDLGIISNLELSQSYDIIFTMQKRVQQAELNLQQEYLRLLDTCGILTLQKLEEMLR